MKSLPGVVRALTKVAPHFGRDARFLYSYVKDMPRTPFNTSISGHRVYETSSLPLHEVRVLAKSRGVTINDVVLALCAGALRRYLAEHAALPEKPLTVAVPVSLRTLGNTQLNDRSPSYSPACRPTSLSLCRGSLRPRPPARRPRTCSMTCAIW